VEEELKTLKEQTSQAPPTVERTVDEDFEQRVNAAVQQRLSEDSAAQLETLVQARLAEAEREKEQAIADAVRVNQEAADAHLTEVIAEKDKQLADQSANAVGSAPETNVDELIAQAVKAREEELKVTHEAHIKEAEAAALRRFKQPSQERIRAAGERLGEKLFNERWQKFQEEQATSGGNTVSQEAVDKAVEEALKKKDQEIAEKVQKAADGAKNEAEMRNKLQVAKLQRQVSDSTSTIEAYQKQFGPLSTKEQAPQQPAGTQAQTPDPPQQIPKGPAGSVSPVQPQTHPAELLQQKLMQAGRGGGIPRPNRGVAGRGRGQQSGNRPAVNRPVPALSPIGPARSPTGPGRRGSGSSQSQLPRPAGGLNVGAASFQPGAKRPRDDEQGGQANAGGGQKRTKVGDANEDANEGQNDKA
jgi:hypothetical protein